MTTRSDYPSGTPPLSATATDDQVRAHVRKLLQDRKGSNGGYAALLITECVSAAELPASLSTFLRVIDADLRPPAAQPAEAAADPDS